MAAAVGAGDLGPLHEQASVDVLRDRRVIGGFVEAGAAAVGGGLGLRLEQLGAAPGAQVGAWRPRVPVLACERPLRALLAQHVVLRRGQILAPFRLGLLGCVSLHYNYYSATISRSPNRQVRVLGGCARPRPPAARSAHWPYPKASIRSGAGDPGPT